MFLVRDILEEIADHVAGHGVDISCSTEAENAALKVFNESQRLLMNRGDFDGTDREIKMQIRGGCITLDRRIETIKQYQICGKPGRIWNDHFKYLQQHNVSHTNWITGATLEDAGDHFALFNDLTLPMHIMACSDRPECEGAELTVYGSDCKGREVRRHWTGTNGFSIPIVEQNGSPSYTGDDEYSSGQVTRIEALKKSRTNGYVYVYGYIPGGSSPVWLVTLAPDETNSRHRRYRVPGVDSNKVLEMTANVSLRWVKQYPGDVALIQNIDAFILMARALNARDDNEYGLYETLRNAAISELKHQKAKKHPAHSGTLNIKMSRAPIRGSQSRRSGYAFGGYISGIDIAEGSATSCEVSTTESACQTEAVTSCTTESETCEDSCTTESETCVNGFEDVAGTALSGHRAVYLDDEGELQIAAPDIAPAVGLIRDAVSDGVSVFVYQSGPMNGFSGLKNGATYYLGANGVPTLSPAESGWDQSIGVAQSETVLVIDIGEPILLS